MSTTAFAEYNLVVALGDLEDTRQALEALREAGISDACVSVAGRPVREVDLTDSRGVASQPAGGPVGRQIAAGAARGAAVGGVLTGLGAAAVTALPGIGLAAETAIVFGLMAGGGAGTTVGAILAGEAALRTSGSWLQVQDSVPEGAIVLAVHTDDRADIAAATEALEALEPMSLDRVNSLGQRVLTAG